MVGQITGAVLALDIGGTKVAAGVGTADGTLHSVVSVPTPRGTGDDDLWEAVCDLLEPRVAGCMAVGVGCGGPMAFGGETVSPLNIPAWRGFPLRRRLIERFELPVAIDNDAKALAIAEGWWGAAVGEANYLAMVVSTGVGGGIVSDGRLLDGAGGNAGHIGHVIVEPGGRLCVCGARGCLEAEASGPSIEAMTGRPPSEATTEVRRRTGRLVGRAVGSVANLLDLRLAVVAGSVALGFGDDFFDAAQGELDRTACIEFARGATIIPGGLGADGPLLGAAAVGFRSLVTHE
ncbi:MAG TPA: ROK family protein [Microthrixaceae bacterium]|nr:ROK family protein [Microthrixaceae bacterium]